MLLDLLAKIQHDIWSHWMKYQFSQCQKDKDGNLIIPADKVSLWQRQLETDFHFLSEKEKESDRIIVRKFFFENKMFLK